MKEREDRWVSVARRLEQRGEGHTSFSAVDAATMGTAMSVAASGQAARPGGKGAPAASKPRGTKRSGPIRPGSGSGRRDGAAGVAAVAVEVGGSGSAAGARAGTGTGTVVMDRPAGSSPPSSTAAPASSGSPSGDAAPAATTAAAAARGRARARRRSVAAELATPDEGVRICFPWRVAWTDGVAGQSERHDANAVAGADGRRPARAPPRGVRPPPARGRRRQHHRGRPGRRPGPRGAVPPLGRALHHPSRRRRHHRGRAGPRRPDGRRRPAPRRRGGHGADPRRHPLDLRRRRRHRGRRGDQARPPAVQLEGGAAGGDHPQDARRHGGGLAGPADKAGRPAAQHAHPGRDARVEAAPHRPGDLRRVRAVGAPPRRAAGALAARGPRLRHAAPQALRGD